MNNSSYINLLVKDTHTVFSFFEISDQSKNECIEKYGTQFITKAVPCIKVFYLENGVAIFQYILYPDKLTNNWYLNIKDEDVELYVVLGLVYEQAIIEIATSNVITTPREHPSKNIELYYVKIAFDSAPSFNGTIEIFKGHYSHHSKALQKEIHTIENIKLNSSR